MRKIGELDSENNTKIISDYLTSLNIINTIREMKNGDFSVWVHSEDELEKAHEIFQEYLKNPDDEKYKKAKSKAAKIKKQQQSNRADNIIEVSHTWQLKPAKFTLILIILSVVVGVTSRLGDEIGYLQGLFISSFKIEGGRIFYYPGLQEITSGQIWRLFTPMIIHFSILHILFNLLWLQRLGTLIEGNQGTLYFVILVLFISGFCNVSQYLVSGPRFGGMSGVVYGLFGYAWMRGKISPRGRIGVNPQDTFVMMLWFFLCWTVFRAGIANTAHTVGLVTGIVFGVISEAKILWQRFFPSE